MFSCFLFAGTVKSQTATPMAQYAGNQMIFNPGFAGAHDLFSANLGVRTLWTGVPGSPRLISLNMHAPFIDQRNALGFIYQREEFGPQIVNLVNLTYAYKFYTGENSFISLGVQAGLFNSITDWGLVRFVRHPEDPAYGRGQRLPTNAFDIGLGIYFQAENFYLGFSGRHLTTPKFDEISLSDNGMGTTVHSHTPRQFFLMGGYNFILTEDFDLRPRFLMRHMYGMPLVVNAGVELVYLNRFGFGTNFASGQRAVSLMGSIELFEGLRVSYAFDMNFGVLRPFQRGSHEILISYSTHVWTRHNDIRVRRNWQ